MYKEHLLSYLLKNLNLKEHKEAGHNHSVSDWEVQWKKENELSIFIYKYGEIFLSLKIVLCTKKKEKTSVI